MKDKTDIAMLCNTPMSGRFHLYVAMGPQCKGDNGMQSVYSHHNNTDFS